MPTINLGSWLGFGHSALHDDGLAGIFLALTGVTGAAVSLAYLQFPAGRAAAILAGTLLLFVAVAIGSDNGFLFFLAWEAITVCVYLIASSGRDRRDLLAGYLTGGLAKIGGAALLAAFALLYAHSHSFSLAVVGAHAAVVWGSHPSVRPVPGEFRDQGRGAARPRWPARRLRLSQPARSGVAIGRAVRRVLRAVAV